MSCFDVAQHDNLLPINAVSLFRRALRGSATTLRMTAEELAWAHPKFFQLTALPLQKSLMLVVRRLVSFSWASSSYLSK